MSATCGNVTCARREHLVSVLSKCASDLIVDIHSLKALGKASGLLPQEEFDRIDGNIGRTYYAIEQLGEKIGEPEEKKPCQHVFVVADECVKCGAPEEELHL